MDVPMCKCERDGCEYNLDGYCTNGAMLLLLELDDIAYREIPFGETCSYYSYTPDFIDDDDDDIDEYVFVDDYCDYLWDGE